MRSQLLVPPLALLLGIGAVSVWMALAAADRARARLETRVRDVARNLCEESSYPLTESVLVQMKRLSGADYLLVPPSGPVVSTLPAVEEAPPAVGVVTDWQTLRLGPPVRVGGQNYLCGAVRLVRPPRSGETLYILYPEALWRDARWEAVWPVLLLGGTVGVASVGLALALGGGLSRRLRELERRTRLLAAGDFSPMPLPRRDDEIRDLARSVNDMAARLAQLQEAVQRTERLRLLGQVSAGLAHQLRNGLTGARLALQVHLRETAGGDTSALEVALRQLTLLEANLKRFLDLGRAGPEGRQPCSLTALVGEAVALLRPQCRHAGIDLRWQPPDDALERVGDASQLGQVVLNLLGNAIDAAGPGGRVEVRLERDGTGGGVRLEVSDSGPGPPPHLAERLFEPFVTGKPEGVGLGLAVARQVVEAHGGRVGWSRADGRTRFRVTLPAA